MKKINRPVVPFLCHVSRFVRGARDSFDDRVRDFSPVGLVAIMGFNPGVGFFVCLLCALLYPERTKLVDHFVRALGVRAKALCNQA